jgi:hypothetical protein
VRNQKLDFWLFFGPLHTLVGSVEIGYLKFNGYLVCVFVPSFLLELDELDSLLLFNDHHFRIRFLLRDVLEDSDIVFEQRSHFRRLFCIICRVFSTRMTLKIKIKVP